MRTTATVVAIVSCLLTAEAAEAARGSDIFRLDFSPFANLELPRRMVHPNNREAVFGRAGNRRRAAEEQEQPKREPCYSVVVRLGKCRNFST